MIAPTGLVRIVPPIPFQVSVTFVPNLSSSIQVRMTAATGPLMPTTPLPLTQASFQRRISRASAQDVRYQLGLGHGISIPNPAMTIKSLKTRAGLKLLEKNTGLGYADAVNLRIRCMKRLQQDAGNGNIGAMRELVKVYKDGVIWKCGDDAESLINLGMKYERGFGSLVKDLDKARICYARMQENVYVSPQYKLRSIAQKRLYVLSVQRPA